MRICVVEDNQECLEGVVALLREKFKDADVSTATSTQEALGVFDVASNANRPFSGIIIDPKIPATSAPTSPPRIGLEVTARAQELFPNAAIVLFSDSATLEITGLAKLRERGEVYEIGKSAEAAPRKLIDYLRNRSVAGQRAVPDHLAGTDTLRDDLAEKARDLRRKRRLEGLSPVEEAELARLHDVLDEPTQEEIDRLREEEERDRRRFHKLMQKFDVLMDRLGSEADDKR